MPQGTAEKTIRPNIKSAEAAQPQDLTEQDLDGATGGIIAVLVGLAKDEKKLDLARR